MDYTPEVVEKLAPLVDEGVLQLWASSGYGLPEDNYFRLVDPLPIMELLPALYEDYTNGVPILSTAFGDLIVFQDESYIVLRFRDRVARIVGVRLEYLLHDLKSDFFRKEMFNPFLFAETAAKVGAPADNKQFTIELHPTVDGQNSATLKIAELLSVLENFATNEPPLEKAS